MTITLTQLLTEIGDDVLQFQMLLETLDGNQTRLKNGATRFSFVSDQSLEAVAFKGTRNAFVVWVDQTVIAAAMARLKEAPTNG